MSQDKKTKGAIAAVFVKFAEIPDGVQVVASSDAGIRRLKQTVFSDYQAGCETLRDRLSHRANPPSSLVCELAH